MEILQIRLEKKGRAGKTVTVVQGFTRDRDYMESLASRLKQSCGAGGTLDNQTILMQGDCRPRLRRILTQEGFQVRG